MNAPPFTALQLMQALQLGHAVAALQALGVMDALAQPREPDELAREFGVDVTLLAGLLDHAARATTLLRRNGRRYRTTRDWDAPSRFVVGLYGLAFGRAAAGVQTLLRQPQRAAALVDRRQHARTFAAAAAPPPPQLPGLLRQLGVRALLDLGCGPATLLVEMARADSGFRGWGIEANAKACAAARAAARRAGVAQQLHLLQGNARRVETLDTVAGTEVQAVLASQFVNEMFGAGSAAAVAWLHNLRRRWPGRWLVVSDYCGRLGSTLATDTPLTLVHDHAQLLSGQGVPPPRRRDWAALYRRAGGRLVHAMEDTGSTAFIHLVAL